ncbi:hypothetical protein VTJ04DRAFT_10909 [Mycothermus thermophilus]|uniref:uncharacterized protein n=1 Tax=Humicola insolens TaxID=85995 RepID=UPI0037433207
MKHLTITRRMREFAGNAHLGKRPFSPGAPAAAPKAPGTVASRRIWGRDAAQSKILSKGSKPTGDASDPSLPQTLSNPDGKMACGSARFTGYAALRSRYPGSGGPSDAEHHAAEQATFLTGLDGEEEEEGMMMEMDGPEL